MVAVATLRKSGYGAYVKLFPIFSNVEDHLPKIISDGNVLLTACPDCDLLLPKVQPPKGHKSQCPRCGRILLHHCRETVSRSLALAVTGILLYFPAVFLPLMTFQQLGLNESGNILQTVAEFVRQEYYIVALIVFFAAVVFPLLKLSLLATVSLCLKLRLFPPFLGSFFRMYNHLEDWAMVEVYLLGIMVTIIKMRHSTDISFDLGFLCFTALVVITMASSLTVCKESFWMLIETRGRRSLQRFMPFPFDTPAGGDRTAAANGLVLCLECGKLIRMDEANPENEPPHRCSRCRARLHVRKPASVTRTWALVLTAAILMFPANLLPIMRVDFLGVPSRSTILDGIKLFFQDGSYFIAMIILTASILIPIFKIVGLGIGLMTIHLRRPRFLRQKTVMFRFIEFIGRWSMLDIFVIALLGFYVNFGFLTSISTAPAATFFCLVVITTMFAATTFDPRKMWDLLPEADEDGPHNLGVHTHET